MTPCLAQKGRASEAETEGLVGAGVVVATGIWSIWAKRKALWSKVLPAAVGCILLCALMLGALGTWLGGLVKGGTSAAKTSTAGPAVTGAGGATCSDGSCSVP